MFEHCILRFKSLYNWYFKLNIKMTFTIYWKTKDPELISRIRKTFNLPLGVTVNGETPCNIKEEDIKLLKEEEKYGFIQLRIK